MKAIRKDQSSYLDIEDAPGKRAVLSAALTLFTTKGIDATTVRDIGSAAGLTNPAMFRHFSGKEELALHLFERILGRLRETIPPIDAEPFADQLRRTIAAYLAFFDEDLTAALYFQENLRRLWPQLPEASRKPSLLSHLRALVKAGVTQGAVSSDHDPRLLVAMLAGLLGQIARQLFFRELPGPASAWLDDLCELSMRCLAPGSGQQDSKPTRKKVRHER